MRILNASEEGSTLGLVEKDQIFGYVASIRGDRLLTVSALNRVLDEHPVPLQEFSAYHDFSGENIAFLTGVAKWKNTWANNPDLDREQRIDMYNTALHIYIDFISPRDAEFPLNLSSSHLKDLDSIFEASARVICGEGRTDPALPFVFEVPTSRHNWTLQKAAYARYKGDVPGPFGVDVFDEVQMHIKDLVMTNTWPKFVREMQRRRESTESLESAGSDSGETVRSRIGRFVRRLV
jgi:hypothetical protein